MTWVDYVILAFLALGAWEGMRLGLIAGALSIVSYVIAWLAAVRFAVPLGTFLDQKLGLVQRLQTFAGAASPAVGHVLVQPVTPLLTRVVDDIAYVLVLIAVLLAASWVIRLIAHVPLGLLGGPNRLGGLLLGAARNAMFVLIVWALVAPYAVSAGAPIGPAVDHSRILHIANSFSSKLPAIGKLLPIGKVIG